MIDRRTMIAATLAAVATPLAARAGGPVSRITAYAFSFPALERGDIRLAEYTGHPFLVVNTASQCGYPAICGPAAIVDRVWRSRANHHRCAFQRFRRPGAGRA